MGEEALEEPRGELELHSSGMDASACALEGWRDTSPPLYSDGISEHHRNILRLVGQEGWGCARRCPWKLR